MSFELKNAVPWGRNLHEYKRMFSLTETDLSKRIISFGDGPASFNAEQSKSGNKVTSLDLIYQFSKDDISDRIAESRDLVLEQTRANLNNFVWDEIKNVDDLDKIRMSAMNQFLADYEFGLKEHRYLFHEMPNKTPFKEDSFDIGLSSHFLFLYSQFGIQFHIDSITEMLRICKEIRIFPLLNLNVEQTELLEQVVDRFSKYSIEIKKVDYEFQKGGNQMLIIRK